MSRYLGCLFISFLSFCMAIALPSCWEYVSANGTSSVPVNDAIANHLTSPVSQLSPSVQNLEPLADGNNPIQLMHQAREFYNDENYPKAANFLEQAAGLFQERGDNLERAIALSNLSSAYQKLGNWERAEWAIKTSVGFLRLQDRSPENLRILAQSLDIQGQLWYLQGKSEQSLERWKEATEIYQRIGELEKVISGKINQIEALKALGLYQQARDTLREIEGAIAQLPDSIPKIRALRSFGDLLRATGELNLSRASSDCQLSQTEMRCDAEGILQKSLDIAQRIQLSASPNEIAAINSEMSAVLLSLGNTLRAKGNLIRDRALMSINFNYLPWQDQNRGEISGKAERFYGEAEEKYKEAIATPSVSINTKINAQLNLLSLKVEQGQNSEIEELKQAIEIKKLPPSRTSIYAQVSLAKSLAFWQQKYANFNNFVEISTFLENALQEARELGDKRAESYVLGNLGGLCEYLAWREEQPQNKQNIKSANRKETALELTEKALDLIQPLEAPDLAYQWEWQLGRLLAKQEKKESAIAAYQMAVRALELIRSDLLAIKPDVQFSFRDNVEPLYRQLLDLILTQPTLENLKEALYYVESLQLAELENFLQCELQANFPRQRNSLSASTEAISARLEELVEEDSEIAIVYPIILSKRIDTIWKLPGENLKYYSRAIAASKVEETLQNLRQNILKLRIPEFRQSAREVYEWLLEPIDAELEENSSIKTLGFVLDGSFRQIPISVLYDRKTKKYLAQKERALVMLPSIQLTEVENIREQAEILGGGISEELNVEERKFTPLKIQEELNAIADEILLNSSFTLDTLQNKVNSGNFSIVHLATHGQFSSDPEETYILVHSSKKSQGRLLKAQEFDTLLRNRDRDRKIELLVLSACETAQGDNRAILGLAGLAVRSGVGSTLATLWKVSDDSTVEVMKVFYQELQKPGVTKAEALHRAQQSLLNQQRYQEPYYWGSYILVGSWR
ncbi:MAG: CHAT domain-containing protein [Cyanobacteriota bacterium]|nr:CHAT domain-containing protein [Cyanobacteriota bacterium]